MPADSTVIQKNKTFLERINLESIFLNKEKLGPLTFDSVLELAENTRKILLRLYELDFQKHLLPSEVTEVVSATEKFEALVRDVSRSDLLKAGGFDARKRDDLSQQIKFEFEKIIKSNREKLTFLRQEAPKDLEKMEKEMHDVMKKMTSSYQNFLDETKSQVTEQFNKRLLALDAKKTKVENTEGEVAAITFGKHFEDQAAKYNEASEKFLRGRNNTAISLGVIFFLNLLFYFFLFFGYFEKAGGVEAVFSVHYIAVKLPIVLLLSYLLTFYSKNYSIIRDLYISNSHRKNVAETMTSFLASNPDAETRSQILSSGVEAMFKSENTGHLGKMNQKDHSPMEQINYILPHGLGGLIKEDERGK